MRIHHLNCMTMCPRGGHLMDGRTPSLRAGTLVCHCLLIETEQGLVLVDTGFGTEDVRSPERLSGFFRTLLRPKLDPDETAVRQVARLGFSPSDVRHIVLTHLDFDHAGGLDDFPNARVHLYGPEHDVARLQRTPLDRRRYRPSQWGSEARWTSYSVHGEPWFGFDAVREMEGLPPEILLIPLRGHTEGHCGVAVETDWGWLLHAGDAYFYREEMNPVNPRCTPGLKLYQKMMEVDAPARRLNQQRLRDLANVQAGKVRLFSAHDPVEFEQMRAFSAPSGRPQPTHFMAEDHHPSHPG